MRKVFDFFKRKKKPVAIQPQEQKSQTGTVSAQAAPLVDFSCPISDEERDIVSAAAGAILAGSCSDSTFLVKSVTGIDQDKEAAAAVVAAVMSAERNDNVLCLKSITQLK